MTVRIIPVSEVRQKLKEVLKSLEEVGDPFFITQHSRPKAVLVRFEDYNGLIEEVGRRYPGIIRRPDISGGEPILQGSRISVRHIVERFQADQTVEEIVAALPHLQPAQVYAALAYYYAHQEEIDQLIEESRPQKLIAAQGKKIERVAEGIAVVVDENGRG